MNNTHLVETLLSVCSGKVEPHFIPNLSQRLIETFLSVASETPDNIECSHYIEYGPVTDSWGKPSSVYGLKVRDKNILVSRVMNVAENVDAVPLEVQEIYPSLTQQEWDAVRRIVTVILIGLECVMNQPKP